MKVTQMPPVHAANLMANSGNTAYGIDVIWMSSTYRFFSSSSSSGRLSFSVVRMRILGFRCTAVRESRTSPR